MSGSVLLDTNIIIAFLADDLNIIEWLAQANEVFASVITLGELYFGARNSSDEKNNVARFEAFLEETTVLDCDRITSLYYGRIRHELKVKGKPIPENDIWIAATALQFDLTLVTRDKHFDHIEGLAKLVK